MLDHLISPDPPSAEELALDSIADEVALMKDMLDRYVQAGFTHDADFDADHVYLTLGVQLDARCPLFEVELRLKSLAAFVEAWRAKHDRKAAAREASA